MLQQFEKLKTRQSDQLELPFSFNERAYNCANVEELGFKQETQ